MKKVLTALALSGALFAASPAFAVEVLGTTASGGNGSTTVEASDSQISVDFEVHSFTPITVDFGVQAGDAASYNFDSFINIFTGVTPPGLGVDFITFTLTDGATFDLGLVSGAFSSASASLNGAGNLLTVRFAPAEFLSAELGNVFGGTTGDFLINRNGLAAGENFSLIVGAAAVPEPATWGMMILGFGVVGAAMRRRRAVALAA